MYKFQVNTFVKTDRYIMYLRFFKNILNEVSKEDN